MNSKSRIAMVMLFGIIAGLTGCTTPPEHRQITIRRPVDAFNAVDAPRRPGSRHHGNGLSADVGRLQSAHKLYERARQRRLGAVQRQQAQCRQQEGSRLVPLRGLPDDVAYCESDVDNEPADRY